MIPEDKASLRFLGAAGTVTGSRYLLECGGKRILIDCGLFQGLKALRLKNREPFPVRPADIDAVLLTHAHLDHTGYLPRLAADGFSGPVYCTAPTRDLCRILLLDSASIMEEEAAHARRHGWSRHKDPRPLYTEEEALRCFPQFRSIAAGKSHQLPGGMSFEFALVGHILGAAQIRIMTPAGAILFSGDLGRNDDPVLSPPAPPLACDYLVVESTYGDRVHDAVDPGAALADEINRTAAAGGVTLIPSFAVGRTQSLLRELWELKKNKRLADIPIYVDSPMASDVTRLYGKYASEHKLGTESCAEVFACARYVKTPDESKLLSVRKGPMIIISASGMVTGGRILHHLKAYAPDPRNAILFAGYQAAGTRGALLAEGAKRIKIHGEYVSVAARTVMLPNMSAHADAPEILRWLRNAPRPPARIFVTHGEPAASAALADRIRAELKWECRVPELGEEEMLLPREQLLTRL